MSWAFCPDLMQRFLLERKVEQHNSSCELCQDLDCRAFLTTRKYKGGIRASLRKHKSRGVSSARARVN